MSELTPRLPCDKKQLRLDLVYVFIYQFILLNITSAIPQAAKYTLLLHVMLVINMPMLQTKNWRDLVYYF
jgi:hypothetical protein